MIETPLKVWRSPTRQDLSEDSPWIKSSAEKVVLPSGVSIEKFYQVRLSEYAIVVAVTFAGQIIMENQHNHAVGYIT